MEEAPVYCIETAGSEQKKRKNRWGSPQGEDAAEVVPAVVAANPDQPAPRRSRFDPVQAQPAQPIMPEISQEVMQQTMILQLQLQKINEKLITVVRDALEIEARPDRSPSPPPRYDSSGKRTNTREVRMREAYVKEKGRLIEELMKVNPTYQAPADFVKAKPVRRIFLPKQTNPMYNYIGLIIGPRGNTQKQMEADTGCKISIRGKGSAKEGSKGRTSKNIDEDEDLHVHITAEDEASVEKASKMIEELLKPQDDALNEHKQKQLRELALINGTLREDEFCPVCGEKGHRQFECPHRARSFKAAGVKCSICGDLSHPTRDCPLKQDGPTSEGILDNEYDSFMAELTGEPAARGGAGKSDRAAGDASSSGGAGGGGGGGGAGRSQGGGGRPGGPIYVAPIVELVPSRKGPQTIIHVTTVMTGLSPPVFTSSMAAPGASDVSAAGSAGTGGYPSYPTMPSLPSLAAPAAPAAWNPYGPAVAYPTYPAAATYGMYGVAPTPYAPVYGAAAGYGAAGYGVGGAAATPAPMPSAPPPPPPAQAPAPPAPAASTNQFHYVYPNSTK